MDKRGENKHTGIAIVLTTLFPFFGLIYSLTHWRESWAKNAFWLACVYLGAVFIYCPEGTILGAGADSGRYVLRLMDMYNNATVTLGAIFASYMKDPQSLDLYQQLTTYLVSRFTDNGHVLFAVFAFVYGFFYSRNIWYILEKLPNKKLGILVILVALYFLICPITNINGARMWTALHVFVYGMMPYVYEKDKSKIWWVAITPFIHFSFLYVAILGLLWFLVTRRQTASKMVFVNMTFAFFLISMFINAINVNTFGEIMSEYATDSMEERMSSYLDADYISNLEEANAQKNWYVGASGFILHWSYNILLLFLLPCLKRRFCNNYEWLSLFAFALFISGFANIMSLLPSGGRFQTLSQMFKVPLFLMVAMSLSTSDGFRKILNIVMILLLLPLAFELRKIFDFFSVTAIFGDFFTVFFWENNVPLIELIK